MNVGELKKLLDGVPDDTEVVVSGSDHSYFRVGSGSSLVKAELTKKGKKLYQWHGPEHADAESSVTKVFWIDDGRY